jgi:hypothetical protein
MHGRSIRRHGRDPGTWLYRDPERRHSHAHERGLVGAELAQNLSSGVTIRPLQLYERMHIYIYIYI